MKNNNNRKIRKKKNKIKKFIKLNKKIININKNFINQNYKFIPNKICLLGLIPYAYISVYFNSMCALTILINGILFHSNFIDYNLMYYIDTIINIYLICYITINSNYDYIINSLVISGSFIFIYSNFLNKNLFKDNNYFLNSFLHVIFVQNFGTIALLRYHIINS